MVSIGRKKSHLAALESMAFRIGPPKKRVVTRFPLNLSSPKKNLSSPPFVPQRTHPEARVWGRGTRKAFTLHKDGDWGKSEAKPKDTMLRLK